MYMNNWLGIKNVLFEQFDFWEHMLTSCSKLGKGGHEGGHSNMIYNIGNF